MATKHWRYSTEQKKPREIAGLFHKGKVRKLLCLAVSITARSGQSAWAVPVSVASLNDIGQQLVVTGGEFGGNNCQVEYGAAADCDELLCLD